VIVAASDGVVCQSVSYTAAATPALRPQRPAAADAAPQPAEAGADLAAYVKTMMRDCLSHSLKTPPTDIDGDVPFAEYGLDSILTAGFVVSVNDRLNILMNQAVVFDHTTLNRLAAHVVHTYGEEIAHARRVSGAVLPGAAPHVPDEPPAPVRPGPLASTTGSAAPVVSVGATRARQAQ